MNDLYENKYLFLNNKGKYNPISTNYLMHGGAESSPDNPLSASSNLISAFADAAGGVASVFVEQGADVAKKVAEQGTKMAAQAADSYIDAQALSMGVDPNAPVEVYTDKIVNKVKKIGKVAENVANDPEVKQSIKTTTSAATNLAKEVIDEAKVPAEELTEELIKTGSVVLDKGVEGCTRAAGNAVGAMIGAIPGADVIYEGFRTGSTMATTGLSMANEAMKTGSRANELFQDTTQNIIGKTNIGLNGIPGDMKQPGLIKASDGLVQTINRIADSVRESGNTVKNTAQGIADSDNPAKKISDMTSDGVNSIKSKAVETSQQVIDSTQKSLNKASESLDSVKPTMTGGKKKKKKKSRKKNQKKRKRKTVKK